MSVEEKLPPNYGRLDVALRSIGYTFEAAVADVIDNSIDAKAQTIMVRIVLHSKKPFDIVIWDDGWGMSLDILKEAMRFGADVTQEVKRLGKFGLGLKLASLSQAKELRVYSLHSGKLSGRGWLEDGIRKGFSSSIFDDKECRDSIAKIVPDCSWKKSGSLVWWSNLYRVGQNYEAPDVHAQKLLERLVDYLSLAFHRFLSGNPRKIKIILDVFDAEKRISGVPVHVDPLNPFGYEGTGRKGFPAKMIIEGDYADKFDITAHIWPPNSDKAEYKLPGGANSRQGFYFYRNNRLIQGGGWNGLREAESHMSLARLEVDMAPDFDVEVSLDVKKVEIQLPHKVVTAIKGAKTESGIDFSKYLRIADEAYRTKPVTEDELPVIPSAGLPEELRRFMHREFQIEKTTRHRNLKIAWAELDHELFFEVDRERDVLYLNQHYRKKLTNGRNRSATNLPVLKCLLFLFLKDELHSEKWGSRICAKIDKANRILVRAMNCE
jgi:hypothetical protein